MATKKKTTYVKGVGQRSTKSSGVLSSSIRIPVADNKKLHRAAKLARRSFNSWAVLALVNEAERIIAEKTIG